MDTSDESFVLADASSDSCSMEMEKDDSGNESNSGKAYKEKLQYELSKTVPVQEKKKSKKQRQKTIVESLNIDENDFQINRSIKSEPNSDFDIPNKKKRKYNSVLENHFSESYQEAEDYLNFRVKQEQTSFLESTTTKSKKNKKDKQKLTTFDNENSEALKKEVTVMELNVNNSSTSTHVNYEDSNVSEVEISHRKKKKKKKNMSESYDSKILVDSEDSNRMKKNKTNSTEANIDIKNNEVNYLKELNNENSFNSALPNNSVNNNHIDEDNNHDITVLNNKNMSTMSKKTLVRTPRIHERIKFEDDSTDCEPKENELNDNISLKLKEFQSSNPYLSPLPANSHKNTEITENDEVWIVKGPQEVCALDFENSNFSLLVKSKVKLNGKTYESIIDDSINTATILSYNNKKSYLRNIPLMGVISLRKRIPKIHIPYDEVMMKSQDNFIPLPDTKCRHPLFGINFKKAIKIPTSIAHRRSTQEIPNHTIEKKRKKVKKRKKEVESDVELKVDVETITPTRDSKKKRKRKHSDNECSSRKAKRVKRDSDNAEVWESEQAIERNLFNF